LDIAYEWDDIMDIDGIFMAYSWDMIGIQVDDAKWGPQTTATLVDS